MEHHTNIKPQDNPGPCLIFAANALGRPEDIPARSLQALREADLLVFEEDRPARLCLKTAGIHRPYLKLTEHAENDTLEAVRESLKNKQSVCYMSDQGLPNVADPGAKLLDIAYQLGARVTVIPGPSSISTALAVCPFLGRRYVYHGFLSQKAEERHQELAELAQCPDAMVFLDTPYRLRTVLQDASTAFGQDRQALIAVDISGPAETIRLGSLATLLAWAQSLEEKLNFVLVIKGTGQRKSSRPYESSHKKTPPPKTGRVPSHSRKNDKSSAKRHQHRRQP